MTAQSYTPTFSPRLGENRHRVSGDDWPCFLCGRAIRQQSRARWFYTSDGYDLVPTEADSNSGAFPVGPECLKTIPPEVRAWGETGSPFTGE